MRSFKQARKQRLRTLRRYRRLLRDEWRADREDMVKFLRYLDVRMDTAGWREPTP